MKIEWNDWAGLYFWSDGYIGEHKSFVVSRSDGEDKPEGYYLHVVDPDLQWHEVEVEMPSLESAHQLAQLLVDNNPQAFEEVEMPSLESAHRLAPLPVDNNP